MNFEVILDRRSATGNEMFIFKVFVDEADCYDVLGDTYAEDIPYGVKENIAIEFAVSKFFKQGYTLSEYDSLVVVEVSQR